MKAKKRKLPRAAIDQLMASAEHASEKDPESSAAEVFQEYLALMDKYSDYFFSEPWPEKNDIKRATTFTQEDTDFLDANDDEFVDRYLTVCLKKNISLAGFNWFAGVTWTMGAYHEQFIRPDLKLISNIFKELAQAGACAEDILVKLKEEDDDVPVVHWSLVDMLRVEPLDEKLSLKAGEVLELIHSKEGVEECEEDQCKWQRKKLKEKTN